MANQPVRVALSCASRRISRSSTEAAVRRGLVALRGLGFGAAPTAGKVWLVGAGPGDPELLTLKSVRILGGADVVVHDRLVSQAILDLAPSSARRLHVGKRKSCHAVSQHDLNGLLVALALEGLTVVRLKGGDPFVFGRGAEEMLACRAAGVPCEVVPGVTAALAAGALAGVPLTHRGLAQAVTFVTGHAAPASEGELFGEPDLDWPALARPNQTVVVYMGLSTASVIADRLIAEGRDPATPVLLAENVSLEIGRRSIGTLAELASLAETFEGPTLLVIGEVVSLARGEVIRPSEAEFEPMEERA
jgi:uroporphyrin-III C-methyltransferase